jgi:hypothetical protein
MMPKTFRKPTDEDRALLGEALNQWHRELLGPKVRVGLVLIEPPRNEQGDATAPAITVAGNRIAAKVRRLAAKARLYNDHDIEIDLDADFWAELTKKRRLALLDHELEHVVLLDGLDMGGRPKLTLQPDDYAVNGFVSVAERHGGDSLEVIQLQAMYDQAGQMLFPWAQSDGQSKRPLPDGRGSETRGSATPEGAQKKGKGKAKVA